VTAARGQAPAPGAHPPPAPATGLDTECLYRKHYKALVRWAQANGADRATAEDAVQAAFAAVHSRQGTQLDVKNERAWLYAIVRNEVTRPLSRERETPVPHDWLVARAGPEPGTGENHLPQGSPAYKAVRSLPPRQRAVLALTVDGYGSSEIAELLGMQDTTVRVHLHAARKKAQARLAAEEDRASDAA
jgi:RNA polymerase sigma factor (sigma-70 family)